MWRRLPLNVKLIGALTIVQAVALVALVFATVRRSEAARMGELELRLDAQADTIAAMVTASRDGLSFDADNPAVREFSADPDFFYEVTAPSGAAISSSWATPADVRADLNAGLDRAASSESIYPIETSSGRWLVWSVAVGDDGRAGPAIAFAHVAVNAQPILDDLGAFKRALGLGVFGAILVSGIGGGIVVAFTTRNLRAFAHQLQALRPPRFEGALALAPQSAEEALLFRSYESLLGAVRRSTAAQRLFIAEASHELKTPIAAARLALEVALTRPRAAPEYERTCRDVLGEVTTMQRLSEALLDLARLSDGAPPEATADLTKVAAGVVTRWEKAASARNIFLTMMTRSREALVGGLPSQWEVVIGNLVDNAVKYGKTDGTATVRIENEADATLLSVQDDGVGMRESELARLGEVFFRADAARAAGSSFGLGFAHAKRLVEALGGTITVASQRGAGTTVDVRMPKLPQT